MRKALFFDIDGTLVNFQGEMPNGARRALRRVQEKGHRIVICTSRSLFQIYTQLLDMGFDGIIGAAGAYVECDAKAIYEHHMEKEALMSARTLLEIWAPAMQHRRRAEPLLQYCDVTAMSFQISNNSFGEISSRGINKAFGMQKF